MSEPKKPIMVKGEDLNSLLLQIIRKRREDLLKDGKAATITGANVDVYEIDKASDKYIQQSDKDEYDCLNEIENVFLIFKTSENGEEDLCSNHDLYDIPGVKFTIEGKDAEVPICIRIEKIRDLAKKAKEYERILGHSIGLKFPNQVHQFRFADAKVPGEQYEPMRPKFASETDDEYEQAVRSYYLIQGKNAEPTEDNLYRKPFPHELTDYKGDTPIRKDENQSEYYNYRLKQIKHKKAAAKKDDGAKKDNGKHRITKSEVYNYEKAGILKNIGTFFGGLKGAIKSEDNRRKIKYATISALSVSAGVYTAIATGFYPILLSPIAVIAIAIWVKGRKSKKALEEAQERLRQKGGNDNGGNQEPPADPAAPPTGDNPSGADKDNDKDQDNPLIVKMGEGLEEIIESIKENNLQIKEYDTRILIKREELNNLDPTEINYDSKKAKLEQELNDLLALQKQVLENLKGDIVGILSSYHLDNEAGGPKL